MLLRVVCPKFVENGKTGFLLPVGDITGMAQKSLELLSKDDQYAAFNRESRKRVLDCFDSKSIIPQYEAFLSRNLKQEGIRPMRSRSLSLLLTLVLALVHSSLWVTPLKAQLAPVAYDEGALGLAFALRKATHHGKLSHDHRPSRR